MASEEQLLLQCTENTSQPFKMPNYSIVWEHSYCRSIASNHARNHNDQLLKGDFILLHCLALCALLAFLWDCHTQVIMPKSPYSSCCVASSVKLLFGSGLARTPLSLSSSWNLKVGGDNIPSFDLVLVVLKRACFFPFSELWNHWHIINTRANRPFEFLRGAGTSRISSTAEFYSLIQDI